MTELKDFKTYVATLRIEYDAEIVIQALDFEDAYKAAIRGINNYVNSINTTKKRGVLVTLEKMPVYYDHLIICSFDKKLPLSKCPTCKHYLKEDGTLDLEKAYAPPTFFEGDSDDQAN